jgi:hypothetical protein
MLPHAEVRLSAPRYRIRASGVRRLLGGSERLAGVAPYDLGDSKQRQDRPEKDPSPLAHHETHPECQVQTLQDPDRTHRYHHEADQTADDPHCGIECTHLTPPLSRTLAHVPEGAADSVGLRLRIHRQHGISGRVSVCVRVGGQVPPPAAAYLCSLRAPQRYKSSFPQCGHLIAASWSSDSASAVLPTGCAGAMAMTRPHDLFLQVQPTYRSPGAI